jgi:hypothetical protein
VTFPVAPVTYPLSHHPKPTEAAIKTPTFTTPTMRAMCLGSMLTSSFDHLSQTLRVPSFH